MVVRGFTLALEGTGVCAVAEWSGDMLRTLTCECPPPLRLRVAAVTVSPPAFLRWPRSVTRVFAVALSPNRRMFPLARSARGDRSSSVPCVRVRPHLRRALPPRIGSVDLSSGCLRDCPISFYVERDKHVEFPSRLKRGMTSDLRRSVSGVSSRRSVPHDPDVSALPPDGATYVDAA